MAATQFEPTDARRAFPCWDEPSIKATFGVTLIIASDLTAVSNTLVEQEKKITSALKSLTFKPTPKMSTYLLAFIVGDLESIETKTKDGRIVSRPFEDMYPLLTREEFYDNMIIEPINYEE